MRIFAENHHDDASIVEAEVMLGHDTEALGIAN